MSKSYFDLLDLIDQQGEVINNQSEMIASLINENAEKENMINSLMNNG